MGFNHLFQSDFNITKAKAIGSLKYDPYTKQFYTRCLDFFLYLLLDVTYHGVYSQILLQNI
jgi:hypothetical protein